jgi:hypothetical protein
MYHFLIASLPELLWGQLPEYTQEDFYASVEEALSTKVVKQLQAWDKKNVASVEASDDSEEELPIDIAKIPVYAAFNEFEDFLTGRIAKVRAEKLGIPFINKESDAFFVEAEKAVQFASIESNPIEREKMLDLLRWRFLEEMETGHMFDFDGLCIYKLKLSLLEKYRYRKAELGKGNFNSALKRVVNEE